ncbi:MAG: hypothetical protein GY854_12655 [Deltaproteobacteria bacterium]|nr:hypothetical protein [Deltaproteobacteria bacterium]
MAVGLLASLCDFLPGLPEDQRADRQGDGRKHRPRPRPARLAGAGRAGGAVDRRSAAKRCGAISMDRRSTCAAASQPAAALPSL